LIVNERKLPFAKFALKSSGMLRIEFEIRSEELMIALRGDHPEIIFAPRIPKCCSELLQSVPAKLLREKSQALSHSLSLSLFLLLKR
jgi:hypothetical protein